MRVCQIHLSETQVYSRSQLVSCEFRDLIYYTLPSSYRLLCHFDELLRQPNFVVGLVHTEQHIVPSGSRVFPARLRVQLCISNQIWCAARICNQLRKRETRSKMIEQAGIIEYSSPQAAILLGLRCCYFPVQSRIVGGAILRRDLVGAPVGSLRGQQLRMILQSHRFGVLQAQWRSILRTVSCAKSIPVLTHRRQPKRIFRVAIGFYASASS